MDKFEQYKERLQQFDGFKGYKEKVTAIIKQKGFTSIMNDTKWLELQRAIDTLPFPPPFVLKCVTYADDRPIGQLEDAPRWLGDWSSFWEEGLPPFFDIEWIKVRPRRGVYQGRLIADKVTDETDAFIEILAQYSIPYENENGTITIYGYK